MGRHYERPKSPKRKRSLAFRIFKYSILGTLTAFLCAAVFLFSYLMGLKEWKEFDPYKIAQMQQTLLIYDRYGNQTAALYSKQNRVYVALSDIPEYVRNAFLAVEDARFYQHGGIDVIRIIGALAEDLKNGNLRQGGSTISQQLVKNTNLTGAKTLSRKLQEAVMAYKLEQVYSKDKILEMYLNYIPFGNGAYGVEAASEVYFGKRVNELTLAQAAMLAGIIKAPAHYAPDENLEKSVERRNLVLSLMRQQGMITQEQQQKASAEPVTLAEPPKYEFGFFTDMVLYNAENAISATSSELLSGGYRIYTTLDQDIQNQAEALFNDAENFPADAEDGEKCEGALVVLDSATGEIRAVVGGREHKTRRCLNRATDMKRQPGSAIKPVLVYAPAMEKLGYLPTTMVLDERGEFDGYIPKNFSDSYKGWVTLREALAESLNLPAVRTLREVGVEAAKLYASRVGIQFDDRDTGLTLALGGFTKGVSPLALCNSFTPFANGGYFSYPSCITKITDSEGNVIYESPRTKACVLSKETSFMMTSMLETAATSGTAKKLHIDGVPIAAKTGTSEASPANRDAWVIAYNPELTACCWIGFDSTDGAHCLPNGVTGGTYPAVILRKLFESVYKDRRAPDFIKPGTLVEARIDKQSLKEGSVPQLASVFTPKEQTVCEYFLKKNVPTQYSVYWTVPSPPDDFAVRHGDGGLPEISFTPPQSFAEYKIMRLDRTETEPVLIGVYKGNVETVSVTDETALYGHTYSYYVIPVHPEIITDEGPLEGPSTAVALISLSSEESYMP